MKQLGEILLQDGRGAGERLAIAVDELRLPDGSGGYARADSEPVLAQQPQRPRASQGRRFRVTAYRTGSLLVDAAAAAGAAFGTVLIRYDAQPAALAGLDYRLLAAVFVPTWIVVLAVSGGYDRLIVGTGTDEFRRVLDAGVRVLALLAVVAVASKVDVSRAVVGAGVPAAVLLTLVGRWLLRHVLHVARRRGRFCDRVLLVGGAAECAGLMNTLHRYEAGGMRVVAACTDDVATALGVQVLGGTDDVARTALACKADIVAVANAGTLGEPAMRRLAWSLERTGVELVVAPGLSYVSVPRVVIRPVDGIPLLHIQEPVLAGPKRILKGMFDRAVACVLLVLLLPSLVVVGLLVRSTSCGPALFRQTRVGRNGELFRIWKFRTMHVEADAHIPAGNDADTVLFKLRQDPRVTPLGRLLRAWSIDELPQLVNVLGGSMSLVGPRPPLPQEVDAYESDVHRRLLVKPGLTGLWQVSGRSDLPWAEAVRLDLQYVENWSLALDVAILLRTVGAVARRRGAY